LPDTRPAQRRLVDTRLVSRVVAHIAVIGLVAFTAAVGLAAARGETAADGSTQPPLFDFVSPVRGANEQYYAPQLTSTTITLDPQAAREEPELLAVRMPVEATALKPTPAPIAADATPLPAPPNAPSVGQAQQLAGVGPPPAPADAGVAMGGALAWPVPAGSLSQGFHAGHLALDIAAYGGATVVAADGGVVTSAGWRNNGGGLVIEIDHGNGIVTVYNHLGGIWVSPGQAVARGQAIAGVGCTGICTGPHVHFEVVVNGIISNPLRYL
jgi:murein DD-endopeptidase MepM/ murein hydrolase activator NlpD